MMFAYKTDKDMFAYQQERGYGPLFNVCTIFSSRSDGHSSSPSHSILLNSSALNLNKVEGFGAETGAACFDSGVTANPGLKLC